MKDAANTTVSDTIKPASQPPTMVASTPLQNPLPIQELYTEEELRQQAKF